VDITLMCCHKRCCFSSFRYISIPWCQVWSRCRSYISRPAGL